MVGLSRVGVSINKVRSLKPTAAGGGQLAAALPSLNTAPIVVSGLDRLVPTHNGPSLRVVRLSDGVEQDIGFVNGKFDTTSASAFKAASTLEVKTWYDQTGQGNHLTTDPANRPTLWLGNGGPTINNFTTSKPFTIPPGVSFDRQNVSIFFTGRTPSQAIPNSMWEFGDLANTPDIGLRSYSSAYTNQPMVDGVVVAPSSSNNGGLSVTNMSVIGTVSSAGKIVQHRDEQIVNFPPASSKLVTLGGYLGRTKSGGQGRFDLRSFVVYPAALSDAEVVSLKASLKSIDGAADAPTRAILMDGDSITFGTGAVNNRTISAAVGRLLGQAVTIRNIGVAGTQISANKNKWDTVPTRFTAQGVQNVLRFHMGRNDIANGANAAQVIADVKTYMTAVRAQGVADFVIGVTALPNVPGSWTQAMEAERLAYNAWIRSNPSDNNGIKIFNAVDDLAAHSVIGDSPTYDGTGINGAFDKALYSDNLHPSEFAIETYMAPSFVAALAAMVPTPLAISGTPVTTANVGTPYAGFDIAIKYGQAPYTISITPGHAGLPSGLSLTAVNNSTVRMEGTPANVGTYADIGCRVTDALGAVADLPPFSIVVNSPQQVVIQSVTDSFSATDVTSFNVALPATVAAGEMLLVAVANDANSTVTWDNTTAGAWTMLFNDSQTANRLMIFYKIADGTEGGKILGVAISAAQQIAARVWRLSGAHGSVSVSATGARATSTSPDPIAVTASWGVANNMYFAIAGLDNLSSISSGPAGFSAPSTINTSASGQAALSTAYKSASGSTDDPGAFTSATSVGWVCATVAVRPA